MCPTVTAIIPTFNRAQFVCEAIESVLAQTRPVDEIIVVDDGSTDDTVDRLTKFDGLVRLIRQPNAGPAAARNRAMKEARGNLISFLDSDDLWVAHKTELQLNFFDSNPEAEFVFGQMANFTTATDDGTPEIKNRAFYEYLVSHATDLNQLFEWLIVENVIPTPSLMFKRASLDRVGFFDEALTVAEDFEYWLRASSACRWGFIDAVLLKRRIHDGNLVRDWTRRNIALVQVLKTTAAALGDCRPKARELIDSKLHSIYYDLGSDFLKTHDFRNACHYLACGLSTKVFSLRCWLKFLLALTLNRSCRQNRQVPRSYSASLFEDAKEGGR